MIDIRDQLPQCLLTRALYPTIVLDLSCQACAHQWCPAVNRSLFPITTLVVGLPLSMNLLREDSPNIRFIWCSAAAVSKGISSYQGTPAIVFPRNVNGVNGNSIDAQPFEAYLLVLLEGLQAYNLVTLAPFSPPFSYNFSLTGRL